MQHRSNIVVDRQAGLHLFWNIRSFEDVVACFPHLILLITVLAFPFGHTVDTNEQKISYRLEGTSSSFARFPRWRLCEGAQFTWRFKTIYSNGLLLYMDDGGGRDFLQLKLVSGHVRVSAFLDQRSLSAGVSGRYADDNWHTVKMTFNSSGLSVAVGSTLTSTSGSNGADDTGSTWRAVTLTCRPANSDDCKFGTPNLEPSDIFIGGLPSEYVESLSILTLPSSVFEIRFKGDIDEIKYKPMRCSDELVENGDSLIEQVYLVDGRGVSRTDSRQCTAIDQRGEPVCLNGGRCRVRGRENTPTCDCSGTGYFGDTCQHEQSYSPATFHGSQWVYGDFRNSANLFDEDQNTDYVTGEEGGTLSSDLRGQKLAKLAGTEDKLSISFRTNLAERALFYTGESSDHGGHLLLWLDEEGRINIDVALSGQGGRSTFWNSKSALSGYNDNEWHNILVTRESRELTQDHGICLIKVTINGIEEDSGTAVGKYSLLISNYFSIGMIPQKIKKISNFRGCMKKVVYSVDAIRLDIFSMARQSNSFVKEKGTVIHGQCESLGKDTPVSIDSTNVSIVIRDVDVSKIDLEFKTNHSIGVLLSVNASKWQISITIKNKRHLQVLFKKEKFISIMTLKTTRNMYDNNFHRITIDLSRGHLKINDNDYLSLKKNLLLDSDFSQSTLSIGDRGNSFLGCLRRLTIGNNKRKSIDLAALSVGIKGTSRSCVSTNRDQCASFPCMHGALCSNGWKTFICNCEKTSYTGKTCSQTPTTVTFSDGESVVVQRPLTTSGSERLSLRFRTLRKDGQLFVTSRHGTRDVGIGSLSLQLKDGRLSAAANLGSGSKSLVTGNGLNDGKWHHVIVRRLPSFTLEMQVDDAQKCSAKLHGEQEEISYNRLYIGFRPPGRKKRNRRRHKSVGFVGDMQKLVFHDERIFELARAPRHNHIRITANLTSTANLNSGNLSSVTFLTQESYMTSFLKLYSTFSISFSIKTTRANGLLVYTFGDHDFFSIELYRGHIRYVFNVGNGPRILSSSLKTKLDNNKWHEISLIRPSLDQHVLRVDDAVYFDFIPTSSGSRQRAVHFDMSSTLYIGAIPGNQYDMLLSQVKSRTGYQGCVKDIDLNGRSLLPDYTSLTGSDSHVTSSARSPASIVQSSAVSVPKEFIDDVIDGCRGPHKECTPSTCRNGGKCVQSWDKFRCDCEDTSYVGDFCDMDSIGYEFGKGDLSGVITYNIPDPMPDTSTDSLSLRFRTTQKDAVLVYVRSKWSEDFLEMELVNGKVFVVYNLGTIDHPIGDLYNDVNDGQYHVMRFERRGANSTLTLDGRPAQHKFPTGRQLNVFNNQAEVQIGGKRGKRSYHSRLIKRPFKGIIKGLVLNGKRILDLASRGDRTIRIDGNVDLLYNSKENNKSTSTQDEKGQDGGRGGVDDDIIFTSTSKECDPPSDQCRADLGNHGNDGAGDEDTLINVKATPAPPTTTPTITTTTMKEKQTKPVVLQPEEGSARECLEGETRGDYDDECVKDGNDDDDDDDGEASGKLPKEDKDQHKPDDTIYFVSKTSANSPDVTMIVQKEPTTTKKPYHSTSSPTTTTTLPDSENEFDEDAKDYDEDNYNMDMSKGEHAASISALQANIGLVAAIAAGLILLLLIFAFILYKYRSRDEGTYKVDETKIYSSASTGHDVGSLTSRTTMSPSRKGEPRKNIKEWYV